MTDIAIVDCPELKNGKGYDYKYTQQRIKRIVTNLKKNKRKKTKFICVCATGSLYVYGLEFTFGYEDDSCIECTKLGDYEKPAEINPHKFFS